MRVMSLCVHTTMGRSAISYTPLRHGHRATSTHHVSHLLKQNTKLTCTLYMQIGFDPNLSHFEVRFSSIWGKLSDRRTLVIPELSHHRVVREMFRSLMNVKRLFRDLRMCFIAVILLFCKKKVCQVYALNKNSKKQAIFSEINSKGSYHTDH